MQIGNGTDGTVFATGVTVRTSFNCKKELEKKEYI